jgi:TolB protein
MTSRRLPWLPLVSVAAVLLASGASTLTAAGDTPSAPPSPGGAPSPGPAAVVDQPDESVLGTIEVNGSAGLPPLPKMGVVPIVPTGSADSLVNLVVRHDMELSGQFEVLGEDTAPAGPFTHTTPMDLGGWRDKGAEYVLRVYAQPGATDSTKTELVGEAYLTPSAAQSAAQKARTAAAGDPYGGAADVKPAFRGVVATATTEVRAASHRLVDLVLGALTGRPGGFASQMTYAEKVGRWRRVFAIDSDGFDLRAVGPDNATAISPAFGPGAQIYYALSEDYAPFRIVQGPSATPVPVNVQGSILGLAFSADHSKMALTVMDDGKSSLWTGPRDRLQPLATQPLANHPVFSPTDKVAYVAGTPVQRVFIGDKAISPPGFMASAPVFCDTPTGLLLVFTVGVGSGADIIANDTSGGGVRRLTQHEGANTYAACSPDGRLVAFFSTGKRKLGGAAPSADDTGAGLFIMPIQRPWLAKKISSEVGESLRWEQLPPVSH